MMRFASVVLSMVIYATHVLAQEPTTCDGCTRFGCESKILERLIKLELDNENLKQKVVALETDRKNAATFVVKMRISTDMSVSDGQRIKYNLPIQNDGNAYNVDAGEFVAPVGGFYMVSVTVCLDDNKWLVHQLIHNGGLLDQVITGHPYHSSNNKVNIVYLEKGDKIWVKKIKGTATVLSEDYGWNLLEIVFLQEMATNTMQLSP